MEHLIGISGISKSGKDFFCEQAIKYFSNFGLLARRFALADSLKYEIDSFVQETYGFSAFTKTPELKERIRPLLIAHGQSKRQESNGEYWIKRLEDVIKMNNFVDVVLISDVRFPNEADWIHKNNGSVIHVTRFDYEDNHKKFLVPTIPDEQQNDPTMRDLADVKFSWPRLSEIDAELEVSKFLTTSDTIWGRTCSF